MSNLITSLAMFNSLFLLLLLVGIIYIIAGLIMIMFPPKRINSLYGYRTSRSRKNQKNWDFAQKFSAIEIIKLGALLSIGSIMAYLYPLDEDLGTILGLGINIVALILLYFRVESAIKKNEPDV